MIVVTAIRKVWDDIPTTQRTIVQVNVNGWDRLTPKAARAALEIAFGQSHDGIVWWQPPAKSQKPWDSTLHKTYGYRVYENSARKVYPNH